MYRKHNDFIQLGQSSLIPPALTEQTGTFMSSSTCSAKNFMQIYLAS